MLGLKLNPFSQETTNHNKSPKSTNCVFIYLCAPFLCNAIRVLNVFMESPTSLTHAKLMSLTSPCCSGWPTQVSTQDQQRTAGIRGGRYNFFGFKRNSYHLWTAIIWHRLNDITHQQVMCFNQGSKFANIFKVHLKHPQCFGTLAQLSHFCRTRPSWHNGSSLGPHVLNGYGSMNTIYGTVDPALVDMWRTSPQNMKYQSSLRRRVITGGSQKAVRVSRRMDCRIGVIKFYVSANN